MKTRTIKNGMIAGLLLFASAAFAGTNNNIDTKESSQYLDVKITLNDKNIVFVNFEKKADELVKIKISDRAGTLLHTERVEDKTAILKRYNISKLPEGTYSFEVSNEVSNEVYLMRQKLPKDSNRMNIRFRFQLQELEPFSVYNNQR